MTTPRNRADQDREDRLLRLRARKQAFDARVDEENVRYLESLETDLDQRGAFAEYDEVSQELRRLRDRIDSMVEVLKGGEAMSPATAIEELTDVRRQLIEDVRAAHARISQLEREHGTDRREVEHFYASLDEIDQRLARQRQDVRRLRARKRRPGSVPPPKYRVEEREPTHASSDTGYIVLLITAIMVVMLVIMLIIPGLYP